MIFFIKIYELNFKNIRIVVKLETFTKEINLLFII